MHNGFNCITPLDEVMPKGINVYPNPTLGLLNIEGLSCNGNIDISNLNGKRVKPANLRGGKNQFNLVGLPADLYARKVGSFTSKLMINNCHSRCAFKLGILLKL